MPKVRDLGISFIPATMRPLDYGDGVFAAEPCLPLSGTCDKGNSACVEPSPHDGGFEHDDDKNDDKNDDKKKKSESHLNTAAIAQLKQQMQDQLGV